MGKIWNDSIIDNRYHKKVFCEEYKYSFPANDIFVCLGLRG
jgi:hypothetical protein